MSMGGTGADLGRRASDLAQRIKAMLSPLEDVCRYREQRSEDFAQYDVTPRDKQALPFMIAIAPGGVNIDTPLFAIRELPVTEGDVIAAMIEAVIAGRVRRVVRLSASGKTLAAKTFLFGEDGNPLYKRRRQMGVLAGLTRAARYGRERFQPYRKGSAA